MVRAIITPNHDTANVKNVFSFDLEFPANLLATDTIVVEFPTFDTDNVMLTNPAEMFEDDLGTDLDNGEEIACVFSQLGTDFTSGTSKCTLYGGSYAARKGAQVHINAPIGTAATARFDLIGIVNPDASGGTIYDQLAPNIRIFVQDTTSSDAHKYDFIVPRVMVVTSSGQDPSTTDCIQDYGTTVAGTSGGTLTIALTDDLPDGHWALFDVDLEPQIVGMPVFTFATPVHSTSITSDSNVDAYYFIMADTTQMLAIKANGATLTGNTAVTLNHGGSGPLYAAVASGENIFSNAATVIAKTLNLSTLVYYEAKAIPNCADRGSAVTTLIDLAGNLSETTNTAVSSGFAEEWTDVTLHMNEDMSDYPKGGEFRFFISDGAKGDAVSVGNKMELAGWNTDVTDVLKVAFDSTDYYFKITGYEPKDCSGTTCDLTIQFREKAGGTKFSIEFHSTAGIDSLYAEDAGGNGVTVAASAGNPVAPFNVGFLLDTYAATANPVVTIRFKATAVMVSVAQDPGVVTVVDKFTIKFLSGGFANTVADLDGKCTISIAGVAAVACNIDTADGNDNQSKFVSAQNVDVFMPYDKSVSIGDEIVIEITTSGGFIQNAGHWITVVEQHDIVTSAPAAIAVGSGIIMTAGGSPFGAGSEAALMARSPDSTSAVRLKLVMATDVVKNDWIEVTFDTDAHDLSDATLWFPD